MSEENLAFSEVIEIMMDPSKEGAMHGWDIRSVIEDLHRRVEALERAAAPPPRETGWVIKDEAGWLLGDCGTWGLGGTRMFLTQDQAEIVARVLRDLHGDDVRAAHVYRDTMEPVEQA